MNPFIYPSIFDALCSHFIYSAEWTDFAIGSGHFYNLRVLEETLTDMHLLNLKYCFPKHVSIYKFNRTEEGGSSRTKIIPSGADWLMLIGRQGNWFSLLVQAKIVDTHGNVDDLYRSDCKQLKQLIAYAKKIKAFPVYCFYSHIQPSSVKPLTSCRPDLDSRQFACAYVPAFKVVADKAKFSPGRGSRKKPELFSDWIPLAGRPWMEPVCCSPFSNEVCLTDAFYKFFLTSWENKKQVPSDNEELVPPTPEDARSGGLPEYVRSLFADEAEKIESPVSYLAVLSDEPLDKDIFPY